MSSTRQDALRDRHRPAHAKRTAQTHAAFLLPHLQPGMDLLDVGCGPGSITVGLAEAVAPGATAAVDLEPGLPDESHGITMHAADATALPFPEGSFDAVYMGALLQHLPDPVAALREARRVARPGAVIGVTDADWGGRLLEPTSEILERSFELMATMHTGSPFVGRRLRGLLAEAGFVRCEAAARCRHHGTSDEVRGLAAFNASWFSTPSFADPLVAQGLASADELQDTSAAWLAWGDAPGAFFATFWCEALGWVE